jgi:Ca2+-binding RTX toxin-like protein
MKASTRCGAYANYPGTNQYRKTIFAGSSANLAGNGNALNKYVDGGSGNNTPNGGAGNDPS